MKIQIVTVTAALALAACGSSNEGSSFGDMASRGESLIEKMSLAESTPVANMPTTGTATYKGVAGFGSMGYLNDLDDVDVMAEATLNANFASSSISGDLTNFRDYENNKIGGSVAIQTATITNDWFDANLDGSLSYQGNTEDVDGVLYGNFGGDNGNLIAGGIEASVGGQHVPGLLVAERQ